MINDDAQPPPKAPFWEQVIAAWPIALLLYGGALGGILGAIAWAINMKIVTDQRNALVRYSLVALMGSAATALYFLLVSMLSVVFPDSF